MLPMIEMEIFIIYHEANCYQHKYKNPCWSFFVLSAFSKKTARMEEFYRSVFVLPEISFVCDW